jgi:hypothetical protein
MTRRSWKTFGKSFPASARMAIVGYGVYCAISIPDRMDQRLTTSNGMDSSSPQGAHKGVKLEFPHNQSKKGSDMKLIRIGVDLAKNVFQVHAVDRSEMPVWRKKLIRKDWIKEVAERIEPGCEVGMEACAGAHHWARQLQQLGFRVKLIAPQFVKLRCPVNNGHSRLRQPADV